MPPSKHSMKVKDISEKLSDRDKYESAQNKIYLSPNFSRKDFIQLLSTYGSLIWVVKIYS